MIQVLFVIDQETYTELFQPYLGSTLNLEFVGDPPKRGNLRKERRDVVSGRYLGGSDQN
jgi:hypothetical protein